MQAKLKKEEQAVFELRSLYQSYGYVRYKMSKFEEYDLYIRNKDFLVSDSIITFNDTYGRLIALKPDVTLSIVKNFNQKSGTQKVYYDENVYRVSGSTHEYKEIKQVGLECIGENDLYHTIEVTMLAIKSLQSISGDYMLDISHMGILSGIFDSYNIENSIRKQLLNCISEKNTHELKSVCSEYNTGSEFCEKLIKLTELSGDANEALKLTEEICSGDEMKTAVSELRAVTYALKNSGYNKLRIDFSVINDMNYYSGIVFQGFIAGIPTGVLSGGQYDKLMKKMGKDAKAIGFAVYLDLLERFCYTAKEYDADTLLLYSPDDDPSLILNEVEKLTREGKIVSAQTSVPENMRVREIIQIKTEEKL